VSLELGQIDKDLLPLADCSEPRSFGRREGIQGQVDGTASKRLRDLAQQGKGWLIRTAGIDRATLATDRRSGKETPGNHALRVPLGQNARILAKLSRCQSVEASVP
jgi:hypothetical protein